MSGSSANMLEDGDGDHNIMEMDWVPSRFGWVRWLTGRRTVR